MACKLARSVSCASAAVERPIAMRCAWLCHPAPKRLPSRVISNPNSTVSDAGKQDSLVHSQIHQPNRGQLRGCRQSLPGRPVSPEHQHCRAHGHDRQRADDPAESAHAAERAPRQLHQHKQADDHFEIRQNQKNLCAGEARHFGQQDLRRQQQHTHQGDACGKPRKAANSIAPQQNDEQNQQGRERERPQNLRC